jgi:CRP-like cAMP-binding protein
MPLIQQTHKAYRDDILYSEGDQASEILFILDGAIKLYFDCSHSLPPNIEFNSRKQAFNVPFSLHPRGSYFGDEDAMLGDDQNARENTAVSAESSEIIVIKRQALDSVLYEFPSIRSEMIKLTKEKIRYYNFLKEEVRRRYADPQTI